VVRCPGPEFCERIDGVGEPNWTIEEMFEEASPGCSRRCQLPPLPENSEGDDEHENVSNEESEFVCGQIEEMADKFHAGEKLRPSDFELWKWDLFVYWRKIERDFERNIQIKLGIVAGGFLQ
jgi:hypothetical protein